MKTTMSKEAFASSQAIFRYSEVESKWICTLFLLKPINVEDVSCYKKATFHCGLFVFL